MIEAAISRSGRGVRDRLDVGSALVAPSNLDLELDW